MNRRIRVTTVALALLAMSACSDDAGPQTPTPDAGGVDTSTGDTTTEDQATSPDVGPDPIEDGSFAACVAGFAMDGDSATYGDTDGTESYIVHIWENQAAALLLEIFTEYGAPTTTGTYNIDATEANYADCSLCIQALTGEREYMPVADSGSIIITEMTLGNGLIGSTFAGSLDLIMQEVTINLSTLETTVVPGGCSGRLQHSFSDTVVLLPK